MNCDLEKAVLVAKMGEQIEPFLPHSSLPEKDKQQKLNPPHLVPQ